MRADNAPIPATTELSLQRQHDAGSSCRSINDTSLSEGKVLLKFLTVSSNSLDIVMTENKLAGSILADGSEFSSWMLSTDEDTQRRCSAYVGCM